LNRFASFEVLDRNTAQQQGELSDVELHADIAVLGDPFKGRTLADTNWAGAIDRAVAPSCSRSVAKRRCSCS